MSGERSTSKPAPPDNLTNVDLYCLRCGYNLRGLSGDPRRCPECGNLTPLSELTLPAEMIAKQLRRMESWPTACIGLALLVALVLLIGTSVLIASGFSEAVFVCCLPLVLVLGAYWLVGAQEFRSACMGRNGWSRVLFEYHLYGLGLCLLVILPIGAGLALMTSNGWFAPRRVWAGVAIIIAGCIIAALLAPWARRKCKVKMDALQREVAVKLAGEELNRRLFRSR